MESLDTCPGRLFVLIAGMDSKSFDENRRQPATVVSESPEGSVMGVDPPDDSVARHSLLWAPMAVLNPQQGRQTRENRNR